MYCARLFVPLHTEIKYGAMTQEEKTKLEERIVDVLKTVYDPEIPVNIYDLGMIYKQTSSWKMCAQKWRAWMALLRLTLTWSLSLLGTKV